MVWVVLRKRFAMGGKYSAPSTARIDLDNPKDPDSIRHAWSFATYPKYFSNWKIFLETDDPDIDPPVAMEDLPEWVFSMPIPDDCTAIYDKIQLDIKMFGGLSEWLLDQEKKGLLETEEIQRQSKIKGSLKPAKHIRPVLASSPPGKVISALWSGTTIEEIKKIIPFAKDEKWVKDLVSPYGYTYYKDGDKFHLNETPVFK